MITSLVLKHLKRGCSYWLVWEFQPGTSSFWVECAVIQPRLDYSCKYTNAHFLWLVKVFCCISLFIIHTHTLASILDCSSKGSWKCNLPISNYSSLISPHKQCGVLFKKFDHVSRRYLSATIFSNSSLPLPFYKHNSKLLRWCRSGLSNLPSRRSTFRFRS